MHSHLQALTYKHGASVIRRSVTKAYYALEEGIESPFRIKSELLDDVEDAYEKVELKNAIKSAQDMGEETLNFYSSGSKMLAAANVDGYFAGNLAVLGGPSGSLKTTTGTEYMKWVLQANPSMIGLYFSKEQPRNEILVKFLAKEASQTTYDELMGMYNSSNPDYVREVRQKIVDVEYLNRLHIIDPTEFSTPADISHIVRSATRGGKPVFWIVDYITLLDFGKGDLNQNISSGLKVLKNLVHSTRSVGLLISQLTKNWNIDPRTKQVIPMFPKRDHLIWSSELVNLAAYIFIVYPPGKWIRGAKKEYFFIYVDKARFHESDYTVRTMVDFQRQTYLDASETDKQQMSNLLKSMVR